MNKTKDLLDQKWDAIDSASKTMQAVRNDLFSNVALALSRIEGRLQFLNGENFEGKPFLKGHAQKVGFEVQEEVENTRKALDEIFAELNDGREKLFNL
tara:strand:- start:102 stop:395 length:294 start_codon:yes stop_codon:yes gene_type:complete